MKSFITTIQRKAVLSLDSISAALSCLVHPSSSLSCLVHASSSLSCLVHAGPSLSCLVYASSFLSCLVHTSSSLSCLVHASSSLSCLVHAGPSLSCLVYAGSALSCLVHTDSFPKQQLLIEPILSCALLFVFLHSSVAVSEWDASLSLSYPSIKFTRTLLYTWVERCTLRLINNCLAKEHNTICLARSKPGVHKHISTQTFYKWGV